MTAATAPKHLLSTDDDPLFLDAATRALRGAGFVVTGVANGAEAAAEVDRQSPGLLILDGGLAGISELRIMEELQRATSPIPVIVISARQGAWHKRVMRVFGAVAVLAKPISDGDLVEHVRQILSDRNRLHG